MKTLRGMLALVLFFSVATAARAESALSLDDLGFKEEQTKGDAALQEKLHKRSRRLKTHQILGLVTAVPLVATVMTAPEYESVSPNGVDSETKTHKALGIATGVLYLGTASFALAAPEGENLKRNKGLTKAHKALAWIHFPAMIAAPILGYQAYKQADRGEAVHGAAKHHKEVAGLAAGTYVAAMLTMVFNF